MLLVTQSAELFPLLVLELSHTDTSLHNYLLVTYSSCSVTTGIPVCCPSIQTREARIRAVKLGITLVLAAPRSKDVFAPTMRHVWPLCTRLGCLQMLRLYTQVMGSAHGWGSVCALLPPGKVTRIKPQGDVPLTTPLETAERR